MLSFHGDAGIKEKYLDRVKYHFIQDHVVQRIGWSKGEQKGCSVGCIFEKYDHALGPTELGLPIWLMYLNDALFEGMSDFMVTDDYENGWTYQFLEAIPVGVDIEKVKAPFLIFILRSELDTFDHTRFPNVKRVIDEVIHLYENYTGLERFQKAMNLKAAWGTGKFVTEWSSGEFVAEWAAMAAMDNGTDMVLTPKAVRGAVKEAVRDIAYGVEDRADNMMPSATNSNIRSEKFQTFANKLLELLRECNG